MIKIALSFDDGRKDNYRLANEVLIPMQISATFNITTDYVENKAQEDAPCLNPAMSKEEIINLTRNSLFEVAGHGKRHNNGFENLIGGIKKLREWCDQDIIGIASPNSGLSNNELLKEVNRYRAEGISYIRTGERYIRGELVKKCFRKFNRIIHSGRISAWVYSDSMLFQNDSFVLNSIPVLHYNSLREIKEVINCAINTNKSCVLLFHSIVKEGEEFYEDLWSWDFRQFLILCHYLKELEYKKKLVICKTLDLVSGN